MRGKERDSSMLFMKSIFIQHICAAHNFTEFSRCVKRGINQKRT